MRELKAAIHSIYKHLGNEKAEYIYGNRLLYSLSGESRYIENIIETTEEGRLFLSMMQSDKNKMIFSAGVWGQEILDTYKNEKIIGFVDNKYQGNEEGECKGHKVYSFDTYLNKFSKDCIIIIASRLYYKEIYNQLINNKINPNLIINAGELIDNLSKKQYFDIPELNKNTDEKEVFVDAGSYDGVTSTYFINWCKNNRKELYGIWAFEPDHNNALKCQNTLSEYVNDSKLGIHIVERGLWNKTDKLSFNSESNGSSQISDMGDIDIDVTRLDDIIPDTENVTFIKMDLEGSEYNALLGAQNTIRRCKPKLAICIYHKSEDVWEIPNLILTMNDDYKFYFGHYSVASYETVLYAV